MDRYRQGGRVIVQKTGIGLKPADLLAKLGKSKPMEILKLAEQPNLEIRGMRRRDDDLPGVDRQVHSRKWICADVRLSDLGGPAC